MAHIYQGPSCVPGTNSKYTQQLFVYLRQSSEIVSITGPILHKRIIDLREAQLVAQN